MVTEGKVGKRGLEHGYGGKSSKTWPRTWLRREKSENVASNMVIKEKVRKCGQDVVIEEKVRKRGQDVVTYGKSPKTWPRRGHVREKFGNVAKTWLRWEKSGNVAKTWLPREKSEKMWPKTWLRWEKFGNVAEDVVTDRKIHKIGQDMVTD